MKSYCANTLWIAVRRHLGLWIFAAALLAAPVNGGNIAFAHEGHDDSHGGGHLGARIHVGLLQGEREVSLNSFFGNPGFHPPTLVHRFNDHTDSRLLRYHRHYRNYVYYPNHYPHYYQNNYYCY